MTATDPDGRRGAGSWIGLALGAPLIAYGVRGVLADLPGVQLTSFLRYFVGAAVGHDLVVGPLVCVLAGLVVRRLPRVAVAPVQAALIVTAVVGLVAWPFVRGYGITEGEPSFLSRNYTASVLVIWGVTWVAAAGAIAGRLLSARRR